MTNFFKKPVFVTRPLLPDIEKVDLKMREIWECKWLTNNGTQHKELELKLKEYLGIDNLVLFNNGTLALMIGLKALELKGEVITTPFTFPATVQALDWNGLTPVFCDIEKQTLNIDSDKIEMLITEKTSAILGVHVFGNPCDINKIEKIANKYNLRVIYDGAHVFGSYYDGKPISNYGDMTMFSFHATKLFNTIEGGGLAFNDASLERKLNLLKNFGITGPEEVILSGTNAKMNEVQAAIGLEVLNLVNEEREKRKNIKKAYEKGLAEINGIRILTNLDNESSSYQYFTIEINADKFGVSRDYLHSELEKHNIFTRKYFYPLCSDFSWYKELRSANSENLPQAHKSVKEVLSMPFYGELEIESVGIICEIIKDIYYQHK
jgi:dTDP-4-amino-4,6-dideoxygalactose transaminase